MASADDLLNDALRLPAKERAHPEADAEWAQELKHRARGVLSGAVETEDADAVLDRISARLRRGHR